MDAVAWVVRAVLAYAVFAVLNVAYKIVGGAVAHLRQWRAMDEDDLGGVRGTFMGGTGKLQEQGVGRLQDTRMELMDGRDTAALRPPLLSPSFTVITRSPEVVEFMLKTNVDSFNKAPPCSSFFNKLFLDWLGMGVFTAPHGPTAFDGGHMWQLNRKIAAGIFTRNNFKAHMRETFVAKGRVLLGELDKVPKGGKVDMQGKFFAFTMDSIMKIFFGRNTETLRDAHDAYAEAYDEAHRSLLVHLRTKLRVIVMLEKLLPWPFGALGLSFGGFMNDVYFRSTDQGKQFVRAVDTLTAESHKLLDAKRADPGLPNHRDLISLFMNAKDDDGVPFSDPKYQKFLRDVSMNYIIAGRDTTACTLSWVFYMLATNPDVQRKVCDEVDAVLKGEEPTFENMGANNVPYLNGLVYEALRLYPPVPMDGKYISRDEKLPGGYRVFKGSILAFFPYAMGRDPIKYPEPEKVKPERWIPFKAPNQFEFPVFQAGPRICLGMNMAVFEAKLLTSLILQKYTFTLADGEADKITYSITLTMCVRNSDRLDGEHKLWLVPHRRQ